MRLLILIFTAYFFSGTIVAQIIESGNKIILSNPDPEKRKINGVQDPIDLNDAVNLEFFINGKANYGIVSISSDTLSVLLNPTPVSINPGTLINFIAPVSLNGPTKVKINGIPTVFRLTKNAIKEIDSAEIISGQLVTVIFDGSNFQCISSLNKPCPQNFIKASEEYCIKKTEEDSAYFWKAIKTCGNSNARICNWAEWYYACQKTSLGILDMVGNYEWIDGTGNSLGWTTPPTYYTTAIIGKTSCIDLTSGIVDSTHTYVSRSSRKAYHCCYSLK